MRRFGLPSAFSDMPSLAGVRLSTRFARKSEVERAPILRSQLFLDRCTVWE